MAAMLWDPLPGNQVRCRLCPHGCTIRKGQTGLCGVRSNLNGDMVSLVRDVVSSCQLDPVEKKPLYHYLPGSKTFSVGSAGCNFRCRFCQNCQISQMSGDGIVPGKRIAPDKLWQLALQHKARSVAFTYNEPTVFFELVHEAAAQAKAHGLGVILVSNGFMSDACLYALQRRVDAVNIDLKSFRDDFYREFCGGRLQPVLDTLKTVKALGWWLEVTTLVIPGCNDSPAELQEIAHFICTELGPDTPWHVTAFHGAYKMADHPPTPLPKLEEAWRIGREAGLHHVYIGNLPSLLGSSTLCPNCHGVVMDRLGWQVKRRGTPGQCPACKTQLAGVWR